MKRTKSTPFFLPFIFVEHLKEWFQLKQGNVGIINGTNLTQETRDFLCKNLTKFINQNRLLWVESICDRRDIIIHNIKTSLLKVI